MPEDKREIERRKIREQLAIQEARRTQQCVSYIDADGCEVTATPGGHAFYNVADWY